MERSAKRKRAAVSSPDQGGICKGAPPLAGKEDGTLEEIREKEDGTLEELEKERERRKAERRRSWDRRELISIGTKLRPRQAEEFADWCEAENTTPYAMTKELITAYLYKKRSAASSTKPPCGSS